METDTLDFTGMFMGASAFGRNEMGEWIQHHVFPIHDPEEVIHGGRVEDPELLKTLNRLRGSLVLHDEIEWGPIPYELTHFAGTVAMYDRDDRDWTVCNTFAYPARGGGGIAETVSTFDLTHSPLVDLLEPLIPAK